MPPPDTELIARVIASDDRSAFGELIQRHQSLDSSLQCDEAQSPLADDGFSARVLAALPPTSQPRIALRRVWLSVVGAIGGAAVAQQQGVPWPQAVALHRAAAELAAALRSFVADSQQSLLAGIVAATIMFAFRSRRGRSPEDFGAKKADRKIRSAFVNLSGLRPALAN